MHIFKLEFINSKGESVELYGRPFRLISIDGLGEVEADVQMQKAPYQDGTTLIDTTLQPRDISIELKIVGSNAEEVENRRRKIASIFNPKLKEGTLRYISDTNTREIKVISTSVPYFPDGSMNRSNTFQNAQINLIAPNPYWLSEEKVDQLTVWEGGLTFTLSLPDKFAELSSSKSKILLNDGDVDTPIEAIFHGPATAPIKLINRTTEKYVEVNQDLLEGEKLIINTVFGKKRVTKVLADGTEINAFHFITLGSSFFNLIHGNNLLDYSTGADYERAGVQITYRNRYLAV